MKSISEVSHGDDDSICDFFNSIFLLGMLKANLSATMLLN